MQPDKNNQPSDLPEANSDNQAYSPPVSRRVIQPVSSEEDIYEEIRLNTVSSPRENDTSGSTQIDNENTPGTLITEPIVHERPLSPPMSPGMSPPKEEKPKKRRVALNILALIIFVLLAFGTYIYLSRKVSVNDLVRENVGSTSYLRPKQWHSVPTNLSTYGDLKGSKNKSTALVSVQEGTYFSALQNASDAMYEQLRQEIKNQAESALPQKATSSFSGVCKSEMKFSVETDNTKTDTTVGLAAMTGRCDSTFGQYKIIVRIVSGVDGRIRYIIVGATDAGWSQNEEAYNTILKSLGVSTASPQVS